MTTTKRILDQRACYIFDNLSEIKCFLDCWYSDVDWVETILDDFELADGTLCKDLDGIDTDALFVPEFGWNPTKAAIMDLFVKTWRVHIDIYFSYDLEIEDDDSEY